MLTTLAAAVFAVLDEANVEGGALESVTDVLDNAMAMVESGGIAVEIEGPESYQGGAENRRDFCTGIVRINCVVHMKRDNDYQVKLAEAEALAKLVRGVLKDNLTLVSTDYPSGFSTHPVRILRTETGHGMHASTRIALAAVVIAADYEESFS